MGTKVAFNRHAGFTSHKLGRAVALATALCETQRAAKVYNESLRIKALYQSLYITLKLAP